MTDTTITAEAELVRAQRELCAAMTELHSAKIILRKAGMRLAEVPTSTGVEPILALISLAGEHHARCMVRLDEAQRGVVCATALLHMAEEG